MVRRGRCGHSRQVWESGSAEVPAAARGSDVVQGRRAARAAISWCRCREPGHRPLQRRLLVAGVVSLVAVHPSTVNSLGKQLLPKTFGQSNVNITQQVVRPGGLLSEATVSGAGPVPGAPRLGAACPRLPSRSCLCFRGVCWAVRALG